MTHGGVTHWGESAHQIKDYGVRSYHGFEGVVTAVMAVGKVGGLHGERQLFQGVE